MSRKNHAHGTENATQTYRRTIQNRQVRKRIAKFRNEIYSRLPQDSQMAGFVFAVNGKIRVADLFGNPVLFSDLREKLVSSYILEALEHEVDKAAPNVSVGAAKGFMQNGRGAKRGGQKKSGDATNYSKCQRACATENMGYTSDREHG